jgi:electron transfer flavoprotein alpha subunit
MSDTILVVCEMNGDRIHRVAYELLGKGRQLADSVGAELDALVLTGPEHKDSPELGELCLRGADRVWRMVSPAFERADEGLFAANISYFINLKRPRTVLFGATNLGRTVAPRTAAAMMAGLTADCTDLRARKDGSIEQIRPAFSDNVRAHILTDTVPQMATVRYKEFPEAERDPDRKIKIEDVKPYTEEEPGLTIDELLPIEEAGIAEAKVVVAGGRAIRKKEDMQMLHDLADCFGGKVGASRALVDAGIAPSSIQVGYSGSRVKPDVYFACGISGAPQHLAGMKESKKVIAINSDPAAPIFGFADVGIVGDIYEIVPKLTEYFRGK